MSKVTRLPAPAPTVGELVLLDHEASGTRATVAPGRGGIVTSFEVSGEELLYLDEATLADTSRSVRGGIPLLFPFPGRLEGDTLRRGSLTFPLPQHGFGRIVPWRVGRATTLPGPCLELHLTSSASTRRIFPWDFEVAYTIALGTRTLMLEWTIENQSTSDMPYALGFHPYFRVADKAGARVDVRTAVATDTLAGREVAIANLDLTQPEVDVRFHEASATCVLRRGAARPIQVEATRDLGHLVLWTLAGKEFVCVEPWSAPANALNDPASPHFLAPGETRTSRVTITLLRA